MSEKTPLVIDGVAESPFEEWPGKIVFPATFSGKMYRTWAEANKDQDEDAPDGFRRSEARWRSLLAIADVQIEGVKSLAFDDVPDYRLIVWGIDALSEYIRPFVISMPWHSQSGDT